MKLYEKPSNAGKKGDGGAKPRRNETDEMHLFVPFQQPEMPEQQITPSKIQQREGENHKIVKVHKVPNKQVRFDPLDPMRAANTKQYDLIHRKDKTNCPKQVKRCKSCKFQFKGSDFVLVRIVANHSWTEKNGN